MQIIRLDDGTHVWVQRIARPIGDPLDTLDEDVARQIEAAVRDFVLMDEAPTCPDILTRRANRRQPRRLVS